MGWIWNVRKTQGGWLQGLISENDGVPITEMGKDARRPALECRSGAQFQQSNLTSKRRY